MKVNMCYLGIDIGTSSVKVQLLDKERVIADTTASYKVYTPKITYAEQKPDEWFNALKTVLKKLYKCLNIDDYDICGIGVSGQMITMVPVDKDGTPVRSAIMWMDQRSIPQVENLKNKFADKISSITYTPINIAYTIPRLLWMKENEPELFNLTKKILWSKDYIKFRLTGEYSTDFGDASGSLMLDTAGGRWSKELLDLYDLDISLLPKIKESHEVVGELTKKAADDLGLKQGIPVVSGSGDLFCENVSAGIVNSSARLIRFGSSASISVPAEKAVIDPGGHCPCYKHSIPGLFLLESSAQAFGMAVEWFCSSINSGMSKEEMTSLAEKSTPGANGIYFYPCANNSPNFDPDFRGAFIGVTNSTAQGDFARAVFEGTVYSLIEAIELLDIMAGEAGDETEYLAVGGGTKNCLWMQIISDLLNKTIKVLKDAGPAMGAAMMAGVGTGGFESYNSAFKSYSKIEKIIYPNKEKHRIYRSFFTKYKKMKNLISEASHIINSK